jgi:hypothetical protein
MISLKKVAVHPVVSAGVSDCFPGICRATLAANYGSRQSGISV